MADEPLPPLPHLSLIDRGQTQVYEPRNGRGLTLNTPERNRPVQENRAVRGRRQRKTRVCGKREPKPSRRRQPKGLLQGEVTQATFKKYGQQEKAANAEA